MLRRIFRLYCESVGGGGVAPALLIVCVRPGVSAFFVLHADRVTGETR